MWRVRIWVCYGTEKPVRKKNTASFQGLSLTLQFFAALIGHDLRIENGLLDYPRE